MSLPLIAYISLVCGSCLLILVSLLQTWEHRRYHAKRLAAEDREGDYLPSVLLTVPCKGVDLEFDDNLNALFTQQYPSYQLCFVVESADDPAVRVIERAQARFPNVTARIVVAGLAENCGQKVHNLMAATRQIPEGIDVLAFADSDACPGPLWLGRLVRRAGHRRTGAVSGYRWFVPHSPAWSNRIAAALNNQVAGNLGLRMFNLVWGGSWAMRREVFEKLNLPDAWQGSLNDDLLVTSLIRRAKLKVVYEPHCLVTSAAQFSFPGLLEFLRRQYFQVRIYTPLWWWLGLSVAGLINGLYISSFLLAVVWAISGGPFVLPVAVAVAYYLAATLRTSIRQRAIKPFLTIDDDVWRETSRFELLSSPLTGLFSLIGILSSAVGRRITWRGIRYFVAGQNRTEIESRPQPLPRSDRSQAA